MHPRGPMDEIAVGARVGSALERALEQVQGALYQLPLVGVALGVFLLTWLLARLVTSWRWPYTLVADTPLIQQVTQQLVKGLILLLGAIVALEMLDLTAVVGAIVGTAGVAGLALGFAFRDIAENYLASLILSVRRPFRQNDHVVIGAHEGKVVRLTTSETVLMTPDGNHLAIPNAIVFKSPTLNYTRNPLRRFDFQVGIGTDDDVGRALEAAHTTLEGLEGVLADPRPMGWIERLGESSVVLTFVGWVDQRQHAFIKVKSAAQRGVKCAFEAEGISMPWPSFEVVTRPHTEPPARPQPAGPGKAAPSPSTAVEDVSVDDAIDRQIAADRAGTDNHDLLEGRPQPADAPRPRQD